MSENDRRWVRVFEHDREHAEQAADLLEVSGIEAIIEASPSDDPLQAAVLVPAARERDAIEVLGNDDASPAQDEDFGRTPTRWGLRLACSVTALLFAACITQAVTLAKGGDEFLGRLAIVLAASAGVVTLVGGIVGFVVSVMRTTFGLNRRACPHCGLTIPSDAKVCRFCERSVAGV